MSKEVLAEPVQKQADSLKSRERLEESPDSRQGADGRILQLQRAMGNRRVAELIGSGQITRDGRLRPAEAIAAGASLAMAGGAKVRTPSISVAGDLSRRSIFRAVAPSYSIVLQRDADSKKVPKPDPAALTNPFESPAVKVEVEKLAVDRLRELTGTLVNQRYTSYLNAVDSAAHELELEEKEQEEKEKFIINAVLTIGLLAAGPAVAAIATEISGDKLLARVKDGVAQNGPRWVKLAGIDDAEAAKYLTNDVYERLSSDTLKSLAGKFSAEKATEAVKQASDKLKDKTVELAVSSKKSAVGAAFLEALKDSADSSSTELLHTVQGMTTYDELLGVYNAFNAMSLSKFREQVKVQAHHFMDQIAPLLAEKAALKQGHGEKGYTLVRVNAYGQPRLATAIYSGSSATYIFKAWITPDMEKTAIASFGQPNDVSAESVVGLEDPVRQKGVERIVKIDAWGKIRLAVVQVKDAGFFTKELYYDFVRWISDSERAEMEARASETQIGGLMTVTPSEVKNLIAPSD